MAIDQISEFSAALKGGIRGNRYRVTLTLPSGVRGDTRNFALMVRASNVPAMETGVIETPFKGKVIKNSGDLRPAGGWTCTAMLNNGSAAANAKRIAQEWQALSFKEKDPTRYKSSAKIELLDPIGGGTVMAWKVEGIWINNSSELNLSDDSIDEILTVDLTWSYDNVLPL